MLYFQAVSCCGRVSKGVESVRGFQSWTSRERFTYTTLPLTLSITRAAEIRTTPAVHDFAEGGVLSSGTLSAMSDEGAACASAATERRQRTR